MSSLFSSQSLTSHLSFILINPFLGFQQFLLSPSLLVLNFFRLGSCRRQIFCQRRNLDIQPRFGLLFALLKFFMFLRFIRLKFKQLAKENNQRHHHYFSQTPVFFFLMRPHIKQHKLTSNIALYEYKILECSEKSFLEKNTEQQYNTRTPNL